ncbi:MAG: ATP-binding protein [Clostridium sp.]|nr:ATP-binding protein [Clostridium sp.]MCM1208283.1 ATP-binding protein [Ruminococcus sp.]
MEVKRDYYLNQLIERKDNGLIKIITGLRRCGKSYLLFELYKKHLIQNGVKEDNILLLPLDDVVNARYRNPMELDTYVRKFVKEENQRYYIFIDEIQFVKEIENPWLKGTGETIGFVDVVLGLMKIKNADIYVTGSNSKMLSSDIVTQFRDKGDEIHLHPLCYSELVRAYGEESEKVWNEYLTYGGLPRILALKDRKAKIEYLSNLFEKTYITDVLERHEIKNDKSILDNLVRIVASSIGALTNPKKISDTFGSNLNIQISQTTINTYLDYFIDSFMIDKAFRYDVKGRKYVGTPLKYYFTDVGIRNALLEFRQQEENHIMENIIYNELVIRGYSVDVGMVEHRYRSEAGKDIRAQLEVDFIGRLGDSRIYVQSALNVDSPEKREQEIASLLKINNSFKKIVVVKDAIIPWTDENGICYVGIREFLSGNYPDMVMV